MASDILFQFNKNKLVTAGLVGAMASSLPSSFGYNVPGSNAGSTERGLTCKCNGLELRPGRVNDFHSLNTETGDKHLGKGLVF